MEKSGKVFTMEGRDALSYDWEHGALALSSVHAAHLTNYTCFNSYTGDPLYKLQPYYTVFNKRSKRWYGLFYNNVSDSSLDMGAEHDVLWGCYRSYKAACGPVSCCRSGHCFGLKRRANDARVWTSKARLLCHSGRWHTPVHHYGPRLAPFADCRSLSAFASPSHQRLPYSAASLTVRLSLIVAVPGR